MASDERSVEAAARVIARALYNAKGMLGVLDVEDYMDEARARLKAADEARGIKVEERDDRRGDHEDETVRLYRFVSDWMPVDNKERP